MRLKRISPIIIFTTAFTIAFTTAAIVGLAPSAVIATPAVYGVTQDNNLVFVKTPWGSSVYIAPVGFNSIDSYTFEIPLSDFRTGLTRDQTGDPPGPNIKSSSDAPTGDINMLIAEANRLYNIGDFNRALQYVDAASERQPGNVRAWVMKGSLMHVLGHPDLAQQAWAKALELDPNNKQIQNILQNSNKESK